MSKTKKPMSERLNVMMDKQLLKDVEAKARRLNIDRAEAMRRAAYVWARQNDVEERP